MQPGSLPCFRLRDDSKRFPGPFVLRLKARWWVGQSDHVSAIRECNNFNAPRMRCENGQAAKLPIRTRKFASPFANLSSNRLRVNTGRRKTATEGGKFFRVNVILILGHAAGFVLGLIEKLSTNGVDSQACDVRVRSRGKH